MRPTLNVCLAILFTVLVPVFAAPQQPEPPESELALASSTIMPKINNGLLTSNFPSTALLIAGNSTCTATLIGCQTALTAAHCVCPGGSSGATCTPNPASMLLFFQHSGVYTISSAAANPNWQPSTALGRHDLAILHLATPAGGIQPSALNQASKPPIGTQAALVGFGVTPTTPAGLKRYGLAQLSNCADPNSLALCYDFENPIGAPGQDSTACHGDSGGPMFVAGGSAGFLAGVTSGGLGTGSDDCTAPVQGVYSDVFTDRTWVQSQAGSDLGQANCGGLPSAGTVLAPFASAVGALDASHTSLTFTYEVPAGTSSLNVTLNGELGTNDFNLYVKQGSPASPSNFDCKSDVAAPLTLERCQVSNPLADTWYLTVTRSSGEGVFQVTATAFKQQTAPCIRDAQTACLQNDRFEVKVSYANSGGSGSGQIMSFGGQRTENTEAAFYSFTSATNFEMGVKVLNACIPLFGNKFWVYASGLTDQAWTLNIRDTQTGAIKTYSNALVHLSTTFADIGAFNCQ